MTNEEITEVNKILDYAKEVNTVAYKVLKKALEQEPCEDCISRQAVLELVADYDLSMGQVVRGIHALLPVIPQQRTGHWIRTGDYYAGAYGCIRYVECSCCYEDSLEEGDYCPNCGCRMVDEWESEDKR